MQIQCPKCKEWIDDALDTCSLCGANLYPLNSCHSDEDNPDLKAFVKQSRDVRIRNIWIASLVGVALVTFVLGIVIQLITPAIIAASVLWFMIYAFIDYWGDKKILAVNNEIPPQIRWFKIKWFIPNGILAIFLVLGCLCISDGLPFKWLYNLMEYVLWHITYIPLLIIGLILLMGMMFYPSVKMRIADKVIKKKCITDQSKQKCPHCQKWTDSKNETCMFCNHSLVDNKYQLKKFEDENGVIDWSLLDKKTARYVFRHHPDRKIYYMGKVTTCGEIHRDLIGSIVITIFLVLLLILIFVLL